MHQLSLRSRILALITLVAACFLVVFGWTIYGHVGSLYAEKRTATRHAVEAAHAIATRYAELARAGTLPGHGHRGPRDRLRSLAAGG